MKEDRKEPRMNVVSYFKITESGRDRELGRVADISSDGLRLQASDPIEPDATYEFEMAMPPREGPKKSVSFNGQVVWCRKSPQSGFYDAGIQLRDISNETIGVIQRIIDNTPFEQRRLSVHRPRPLEH